MNFIFRTAQTFQLPQEKPFQTFPRWMWNMKKPTSLTTPATRQRLPAIHPRRIQTHHTTPHHHAYRANENHHRYDSGRWKNQGPTSGVLGGQKIQQSLPTYAKQRRFCDRRHRASELLPLRTKSNPTARENARLQSFKDDWVPQGSKTSQYKQIGNAVPPLLAENIARNLINHL